MQSNVMNLRTNMIVTVYTKYGSRVPMVLCSLCKSAKHTDLASKSYRNTAKACERCGKLSDSVVL